MESVGASIEYTDMSDIPVLFHQNSMKTAPLCSRSEDQCWESSRPLPTTAKPHEKDIDHFHICGFYAPDTVLVGGIVSGDRHAFRFEGGRRDPLCDMSENGSDAHLSIKTFVCRRQIISSLLTEHHIHYSLSLHFA